MLLGEASHGTHEFYRERAAHHPAADRRAGLQRRRRRGRLARRLPRQPLRPRPRRRRRRRGRARRLRALSRLDVAQHRRARLRRLAARAQRGAAGREHASASTASTCTACSRSIERGARLPRPRRPGGGARARATATPASSTSARTARPTATPRASTSTRPARTRWSPSCASCVGARRRADARRGRRRRATTLFYAEQNARLVQERRGVLPDDVPRPRLVVEPARPPHGRDARRRSSSHLAPRAAGRPTDRRLGAQLAPRRRPRHRDGRQAASCNVGQLVRERYGARRGADRLHHLRRHRHGGRDWDEPRRAQAGAARASPAATRRCSTRVGSARFCLVLRGNAELAAGARARRAWSAPSASSTGRETERQSHYFHARLPAQFDAVIHLDETRAAAAARPAADVAAAAARAAGDLSLRGLSAPGRQATRRRPRVPTRSRVARVDSETMSA